MGFAKFARLQHWPGTFRKKLRIAVTLIAEKQSLRSTFCENPLAAGLLREVFLLHAVHSFQIGIITITEKHR